VSETRTTAQHAATNPSQRGSTLILVLAVLSILILIAATLSYTARLEEISSRNFADGIQSRIAAQTGVAQFFAMADGRATSVTLLWASAAGPVPSAAPSRQSAAPGSPFPLAATPVGNSPFPAPPLAGNRSDPRRVQTASSGRENAGSGGQSAVATDLIQLRIVDESSKINVNALGSWAELGTENVSDARRDIRVFGSSTPATSAPATGSRPVALADALYAVLSSREVNYPGASREMAHQIASSILRYRYGPDGQPGVAGVDDDNDGPGSGAGQMVNASATWLERGSAAAASSFRRVSFVAAASQTSGQGDLASADTARDGLDNDGDGVADEAGEGVDEPDEFVADPRLPPNGDDRPFRQVEDLLGVSGMTTEMFQALHPYLTVFSASERRIGPQRDAPAQLDLNAATPEEIYRQLSAAFPDVPAETLAQFTANIVDYRDGDSAPTLVQLDGVADVILGAEVTPCITEVWSDSVTDQADGDNGEFIEIYNPYDKPISLAGWSLEIAGSASGLTSSQADSLRHVGQVGNLSFSQADSQRYGRGARVSLRGTLVAGGFLIVTDNYNGRNNPKASDEFAGYGSFYRIFGVVPNTRNHLMIEIPTLDVPDSAGRVELRDASGCLVDFFQYGGGVAGGVRRSFQRSDPRVRVSHVARCTPYALPPATGADGVSVLRNLLAASTIKNAPFQSALELFSIGSPFTGQGPSQATVAWQTPTIGLGRAGALDERLADLFTVWTDRSPQRVMSETALADAASTLALSDAALEVPGPSALTEHGKINLNSASRAVLRALPGLTDQQIEYLLSRRLNAPATDSTGCPVTFRRLSELLADDAFWAAAPTSARLAQVSRWLGSITFTSRAYSLVSENLTEPATGPRLASRAKVEAVVSTDGGRNQVVAWRYAE
jgi:DNA uptake protein ComE-like DNA-binding protein